VGRPHGTAGAFTVADPTERTELLEPGRTVVVGRREVGIAARQGTAEHPILSVGGVNDRNAAEALRGEPISVPRAALGSLGENEFLVDDLVGCEVADGERPVGRVRDVLLLPSADSLEVELEGGGELLVPLVDDAVREIDVDARRIDVDTGFLAT
jgi:16S rRNA processing protein RimM